MKGIMMLVFALVMLVGCQKEASYDEAKAAFDQIPPGYEMVLRRIGDPGPCTPATDMAESLKPTPATKPVSRTILPTKSAESKPVKPAAKPATKKVAAAEESAPEIPPAAGK